MPSRRRTRETTCRSLSSGAREPVRASCLISPPANALLSVTILLAEEELTASDLIIGLLFLQSLSVDMKTLLEKNCATQDGTYCDDLKNLSAAQQGSDLIGRVRRLSSIRSNGARAKEDNRTCADYYINRATKDKFPDATLLDPIGEEPDSNDDVRDAVDAFIKEAEDNGILKYKTG